VQFHGRKGMSEHEAHALRHVALPMMRPLSVVAEVGGLEHSANDLAQHEDADNGIVEEPADEEAFDIRLAAAGHPPGEGFRVGGWQHPASMQRATQPVRRNDPRPVAPRRLAEVDAFTNLEGPFVIRFRHAVPTIPEPR
jgi:hypothetical protein